MDKVTFSEAAKAAGVHRNTLTNWLKAGKLHTAEKVISRGNVVWMVELSEVLALAHQGNLNPAQQSVDYTVNQEPPQSPSAPPNVAIIPAEAYASLLDLVKSQGEQIKELALEVGQLREKVKQQELSLDNPQIEPLAPAVPPEQPTQPVKKRWWQRQ